MNESLSDATEVGLAVAVVLDGCVELHLRGQARPGEAVQADDTFAWGSITKTVTAALLALLAADGVVGLDQPLSELLPGAPPLALADLASHTAGLPRLLPSPWSYVRSHDAGDPYATEDADRLLAALARTRLRSPRVRYSNAGAGLLGLALVTATGRAYAELVRDHVATPLGLTTLSTAEPTAQGHDRRRRPVPPWHFSDAVAGCGAVTGSVRDLARWVLAAGGEAPEPLGAALRTATTARAGDRRAWIGLGWHGSVLGGPAGFRSPSEGEQPVWWHNGATNGFAAFAGHDSATGRGVAVLSNTARSVDAFAVELLRG
ncbi:MAG: beta-lactamase family protein [Frankiales bacterium]|nr:beta-lactamase family protein [Frankiales bacterium]